MNFGINVEHRFSTSGSSNLGFFMAKRHLSVIKQWKSTFFEKDLFESYSMRGVWIWVPLLSRSCWLAWNQRRSRLPNKGISSVIWCAQTESNHYSCRNSIWDACINLCYDDMFCQRSFGERSSNTKMLLFATIVFNQKLWEFRFWR